MNKTGFGFLRLPRLDPEDEKSIDLPQLCALVDRFPELAAIILTGPTPTWAVPERMR